MWVVIKQLYQGGGTNAQKKKACIATSVTNLICQMLILQALVLTDEHDLKYTYLSIRWRAVLSCPRANL